MLVQVGRLNCVICIWCVTSCWHACLSVRRGHWSSHQQDEHKSRQDVRGILIRFTTVCCMLCSNRKAGGGPLWKSGGVKESVADCWDLRVLGRRKRGRSRSYSSDSRSYSRSRSPSTSEPSRGPLRQPPQLRGETLPCYMTATGFKSQRFVFTYTRWFCWSALPWCLRTFSPVWGHTNSSRYCEEAGCSIFKASSAYYHSKSLWLGSKEDLGSPGEQRIMLTSRLKIALKECMNPRSA